MSTSGGSADRPDRKVMGLRDRKATRPADPSLADTKVVSLAREVLARVAERTPAHGFAGSMPTADQIDHLCFGLISDDEDAGAQFIRDAQAGGAGVEVLYLTYLAGAARQLGDWWASNHISLVDVTIGTSRIYAIMRTMKDEFPIRLRSKQKTAVFAVVPGEDHTLGITMAADLFRKKGWDVRLLLGMTHNELVNAIGQTGYGLIGLSAGGLHAAAPLARLIVALRISNPQASIVLGGKIVEIAPNVVAMADIDGVAPDIPTGEATLERLWHATQNQNAPSSDSR